MKDGGRGGREEVDSNGEMRGREEVSEEVDLQLTCCDGRKRTPIS